MEKSNELIGRLNKLMSDIDEYNKENKDKINVGLYVNHVKEERKYKNRVSYYRNMDKNVMRELMGKEKGVSDYIKSLNKVKKKRGEINKPMKNVILMDRYK